MLIFKTRSISILLLLIFTLFTVSGCSTQSVSKEEYNNILKENNQLKAELDTRQETVNTKITGSFTATVRHLIPDYVLDNSTPTMAVLTCFQSSSFIIHVGEEMASKLVEGETYHFQLKETPIGYISRAEFDKGNPNVEKIFCLYDVDIESFRLPKESEYGLESVYVNYKEVLNDTD